MQLQSPKRSPRIVLLPWLEAFGVFAWGMLLLKYWLTGQIKLLIHPDYIWLSVVGGIGLAIVSLWKMAILARSRRRFPDASHSPLLPPAVSASILILTAIVGFVIAPRPFASQTALELGVADLSATTRSQPQSFRSSKKPEERSLIDWTRTLSVYPEPDAYSGQKANVIGFAIHPPELPENYIVIARFVITCCAADAYPIGLPVKLSQNRSAYPADTWFQVRGEMITETFSGKRQLVIQASAIEEVPEPDNPYDL